MSCPFCDPQIIEDQQVYENATERVILNIRPAKNLGRCSVVPKRHVSNIREFTEEEAASFLKTVKLVAEKINLEFRPLGFNYGLNEGAVAGQTVEHLHFHIVPRYKNDGIPEYHLFHRDPKEKTNLSSDELLPIVEKLRRLF